MKLASFDPGQLNFAWTISRHRLRPGSTLNDPQFKVLRSGQFKHTITDLNDSRVLQDQLKAFLGEFETLVEGADAIVLERYMSRGVKVGTTSETVNIMIGSIISWCLNHEVPCHIINPAVWKNQFNSATSLKEAYSVCKTTPHQLDSFLIGMFQAHRLLGVKPFNKLCSEYLRDKMLTSLEQASVEKLVKRRKVRNYSN